ncbi:MAG: hypothetical protein K9G70_04350 [Prolixibacteraceae bacterium]|nr:hypothetical protein [Prolixibacteraceae bacterium]
MGNGFSVIENKIHKFTKKYYLDKILKGSIFFIILFLIISASVLTVEYFTYLQSNQKVILLSIYFISLFIAFVYLIGIPLFGFLGIVNNLSNQKMNSIIVQHFPEIQDQLLNLFELRNNDYSGKTYSDELLIASIQQKIDKLNIFQFSDAISFKNNIKFSIVLIALFFVFGLTTLIFPDYIKTTSERLVNYKISYTKPSPFSFKILNENLTISKGDNIRLNVAVETDVDYENVYIEYGDHSFMMKHDSTDHYSYLFTNVNNSINFRINIDDYYSDHYKLTVQPKPILTSFTITVDKPSYTDISDEDYNNLTEVVVPTGSECTFTFNTVDTDSLYIQRDSINNPLYYNEEYSFIAYKNTEILLSLYNEYYLANEVLKINVETISDQYPSINVNQMIDSVDFTNVYFKGLINDDYGFSKLRFITEVGGKVDSTYELSIHKNITQQNFFYGYDFQNYAEKADKINYYFEVSDNDAVNGPKKSVSEFYTFIFPDANEVLEHQDNEFEDIEQVIDESLNLTNSLKNDIDDLQRKLIDSDMSEYERNETIKNIISKKESLEDAVNNIKERNEELKNYMQSFSDQNEELVKKQEQIDKLLDEVMSDELKKMMDEFNEMMENFDKDKMNELNEEMDISLDDLSKQLDRNLEMLKRMQMEQKLGLMKDEIQKHAEKQKQLSEQIQKGTNPDELIEEQQNEKEALEKLKDQYKKVQETNDQLENPLDFFDFDKEFDDIDKEFDNSIDQQQKNNKRKSGESMQQNQMNMEQLAEMMQQMMDAAFMEQTTEDLQNLLQILDNTVTFSFKQEELITLQSNSDFDHQIMSEQKELYRDFQVIKDSLYALAMRQPSVDAAVNKEIVTIETSFSQIDKDFNEDRIRSAKSKQQVVLTSANNLALFLSEVIKNIQQQMANSQPGNQNCEKPGNSSNPNSMSNSLKGMQKSLQQQLEKMMQMMKQGEDGQKMNGEMGKALSQQEKMQDMLQKLMNQGNVGSKAYETLKDADELLNKVREDILRNNLSDQTINRQQQIMTRLLEADNAQNERDLEEKRKSQTAEEQRLSETAKYFDNSSTNTKFNEQLLRKKLILKHYYQKKFQDYVNQLDSINGQEH